MFTLNKTNHIMFSSACELAQGFTFPIVICQRQYNKECKSGMGAFVVVNEEGWAVTAYHIIDNIQKLAKAKAEYLKRVAERQAIEDDPTLKNHIKIGKLRNLAIAPTTITDMSISLGNTGTGFGSVIALPAADLAAFRINGFNAAAVRQYPRFKNPSRPMRAGTSLCKLGFPFYSISPTYDEKSGRFNLPAAFPIPLFPIEGIMTREVEIVIESGPQPPYPYKYIETSSPGLRGQSGGPTFDVNGDLWAIQSQTKSYPLGFGDNAAKSKEAEHMQNQYFNAGWGVHSSTITNFLTANNISPNFAKLMFAYAKPNQHQL